MGHSFPRAPRFSHVGERLVGRGEVGEFAEDFFRRGVVHGVPHATRYVTQDFPVEPGFSGQVEGRATHLNAAVGVGVGALFFHVGAGGQDDVGELGGLGKEDVLDDKELEVGKRFSHLVDVGVREEGVLSHDVHATDRALERTARDFDDGEPGFGRERTLPGGFKLGPDIGVPHRLVVGVDHRNEPGVARTLYVVLAP